MTKNTILVIDDDKNITDRLVKFLTKEGFSAIGSYSGPEGLNILQQNKVDLVITDMKMPEMSGLEILKKAKEINPQIEVVMISGYPTVEIAVEAIKSGAYDYIQKPINLDELLILINRCLEKRTLEEKLNIETKLREELEKANKELREKQAQLIQAEKLATIGQFAAGVAHEINNPLTAITMNIASLIDTMDNLARGGVFSNQIYEKVKKKLKIVESETDRAAKIVKSLLMMSRKSKDEEKKSVNINDVIENTLSPIEHQLQLSNINVIRLFSSNLPNITVNVEQIQQVFLNIINNARDAMPSGGELTIITKVLYEHPTQSPNYIEISFTDTGKGIAEENLTKIFDPFYTTKEPGKGTGLGLSVSQSIISNHGGEIKVQSKVGSGTTFTIILPVR